MRIKMLVASLVMLASCATGVQIDSSPGAVDSGDFTLINSLSNGPCASLPAQGADICRFHESTPIESVWRLVMPSGPLVVNGEVTVYWRDVSKTFAVSGPVLEIPLKDLIGHAVWASGDSDAATAIGSVNVKAVDGTTRQILFEGLAVIIVLKAGYDPLPVSSSATPLGQTCHVQFSTAGRSSLVCE